MTPYQLTRDALRPVAERVIAAGGSWHDVADHFGVPEYRARVMGNRMGIKITAGRPPFWTDERIRRAAAAAVRTSLREAAAAEGVTRKALAQALRAHGVSVRRIRRRLGMYR